MPAPRSSGPLRPPGRVTARTSSHAGRSRSPSRPTQQRPLAVTAAWAGLASALIGCVSAIAVVAVLWLPASGGSGSAGSSIRAGILTFLAGVHGGVTVDGVPTAFVPLGLTALVAVVVWRAATAVAAAAEGSRDAQEPATLVRALVVQSGAFALTCAVLAATASLGSSSASIVGSLLAGFVLTALVAGAAMLRRTPLGDVVRAAVPPWLGRGVRCSMAGLAVYVGAGALLSGVSLVLHHERVMALSNQVGGGWSSVPILVLGVLTAPNAAVAGAGYLSGAGFAVGSGTTVGLTGSSAGLVPAFPILGALPTGGASVVGWLAAAATALGAGAAVAAVAGRADTVGDRWRSAASSLVGAALLAATLAWQGGGGIGSGRLHVVGVSPWQFALWTTLWTAVASTVLLALRSAVEALREHEHPQRPSLREAFTALTSVEDYGDDADDGDADDDDNEDAAEPDSESGPARGSGVA